MARNEEKAMTLFSKWSTFKEEAHAGEKKRRPILASQCSSLADAERWRREIVRDVVKKVSAIQNAGLGEHRIRELNDEINKLYRTKQHWEKRIIELGGNDHSRTKTFIDVNGKELPGAPGYKYFGAAKDLPGVRELFQETEDETALWKKKRSRADLYKNISPDYYGFRDEDDGLIVPMEEERERELVAQAVEEYEEKKRQLRADIQRSGGVFGTVELALMEDNGEEEDEHTVINLANKYDVALRQAQDRTLTAAADGANGGSNGSSSSQSAVPSSEEIGELIVNQKKKMLLDKFL
jgi:pre-mRNA-splicing factor ISY1